MKTKQCFKCHIEKSLGDFYVHKQMGDGHLNKCKSCAKLDVKTRSVLENEKIKEYDKLRYRTNIERIKMHKYRGIVERCEGGHKNRTYLVEGMKYLSIKQYLKWWEENKKDFEKCYKIWKKSGYKNKFAPSIDRIDSQKGYTAKNMQWLVFTDNCKKYNK
jgi:hypothetical protein